LLAAVAEAKMAAAEAAAEEQSSIQIIQCLVQM
jgi:hypothetical protein